LSSNDCGEKSADNQRTVVPYELGFGTFVLTAVGCLAGLIFMVVGVEGKLGFFIDCCGIGSLIGLALDLIRLKYSGGSARFWPAQFESQPAAATASFAAEAPAASMGGQAYAPETAQGEPVHTSAQPGSARAAAMGADDFGDIPTPVPNRPPPSQSYAPPPPQHGPAGYGAPRQQPQNAYASSAAAYARRQQEQQDKRRRFATCFARAFLFVARADGVTRPSEMAVVDRFFTQKLGFRSADDHLLDRALSDAESNLGTVESLCEEIKRELNRGEILTLFNGLYDVATIDGDLGKSEAAIISRLADMLGVTNAELRQIRAQFVPEAPEHYALLGLMPEASVSEIKSAFHRAVLENHPDRVAHLGEQAARMATQRFLEVQKAYEAIRQERGF